MFGHSLSQDYAALMSDLSFTPDEVRALILNGIESSWLEPERKSTLEAAFVGVPDWNEDPA
jgi:adenosine deaminase